MRRLRWGPTATLVVLLAGSVGGLAACGRDERPTQVQAGAVACDPTPTGPLTDEAGGLLAPGTPRPDGWQPPAQDGFDWDGDGRGDHLAFDQDAATVAVVWAQGSLTVRGVRSDFAGEAGQPVEPGGDPFLDQPTESGPPSPESVAQGTAAPVPAAVADVTGDGRLDLLVVDGGTAAVVAGQGAATPSTVVRLDQIGEAVPGWRNPPVVPVAPPGFSDDQPPVPYETATVSPRWDLTGDGIDDWVVESILARARGPLAVYAGKPCG